MIQHTSHYVASRIETYEAWILTRNTLHDTNMSATNVKNIGHRYRYIYINSSITDK